MGLSGVECSVSWLRNNLLPAQLRPRDNWLLSVGEGSQQTDSMICLRGPDLISLQGVSHSLVARLEYWPGTLMFSLSVSKCQEGSVSLHTGTMAESGSVLVGMRSGPIRALNWAGTCWLSQECIVVSFSNGQRKGGQETNPKGLGICTLEGVHEDSLRNWNVYVRLIEV